MKRAIPGILALILISASSFHGGRLIGDFFREKRKVQAVFLGKVYLTNAVIIDLEGPVTCALDLGDGVVILQWQQTNGDPLVELTNILDEIRATRK